MDRGSVSQCCPYTPVALQRGADYTGNYYERFSLKAGRNVRLQSELEYANWLLRESDPECLALCERPLEVTVMLDGKRRTTIFDLWTRWRDGHKQFEECKYRSSIEGPTASSRDVEQIRAQKLYCAEHAYTYQLVTDDTVRAYAVRLSNWNRILGHLIRWRDALLRPIELELVSSLRRGQPMTLPSMTGMLRHHEADKVRIAAFRLVYQGVLASDLDTNFLSKATQIWLGR